MNYLSQCSTNFDQATKRIRSNLNAIEHEKSFYLEQHTVVKSKRAIRDEIQKKLDAAEIDLQKEKDECERLAQVLVKKLTETRPFNEQMFYWFEQIKTVVVTCGWYEKARTKIKTLDDDENVKPIIYAFFLKLIKDSGVNMEEEERNLTASKCTFVAMDKLPSDQFDVHWRAVREMLKNQKFEPSDLALELSAAALAQDRKLNEEKEERKRKADQDDSECPESKKEKAESFTLVFP